jgi:hypothetical protein
LQTVIKGIKEKWKNKNNNINNKRTKHKTENKDTRQACVKKIGKQNVIEGRSVCW